MTHDNTDSSGERKKNAMKLALLMAAVLSLVAKMLLATQGNNFDMESFQIVADLTLDGKTVYAETTRYNYGPVWAYVLALLRFFQTHVFGNDGMGTLHMLIAGLLGYVDIGIGIILALNYSFAAGLIFLLNPVSLLITGYHSQFDNLAILAGIAGTLLLFKKREDEKISAILIGSLLLGVSLAVKHVLIFFPIWLFFRPDIEWKKKLIICSVPYAVFAAGFAPFVFDHAALQGIASNIFHYSPFHLTGFYNHLVGVFIPIGSIEKAFAWVPIFSGFKFVWGVTLLATGFLLRKLDGREFVLFYLLSMCVFSSQMADQYLVIPMAACAVFWRSWTIWAYMVAATLYLLTSPDNISFVSWTAPLKLFSTRMGLTCWKPMFFLFILIVWTIVGTWWKKSRRETSG